MVYIRRTIPSLPALVDRLAKGIDVLDIGCGSGHAINLMAREFPRSRFTGYDFSPEAIAAVRKEAAQWRLANARFEVKDVTALSESIPNCLCSARSVPATAYPNRRETS